MSGRSPEEREAARRAREARRGARFEGSPPHAAPFDEGASHAAPFDVGSRHAAPFDYEESPAPAFRDEFPPAAPPHEQHASSVRPAVDQPTGYRPPPGEEEPAYEEPMYEDPYGEPAFAFRRDGHDEPEDYRGFYDDRGEPSRRGRLARPGRGPAGARASRRADAGPRPHRRRRRVLAAAGVVVAVVVIWFLVSLFQPFNGSGHGSVVVTIPIGSSTSAIGHELARDGVISSSFFFGLRAELAGDRGEMRAGTYHLRHGMSYSAVLTALTTVPAAAPTTNVTIIPGRTRRQIADLLHREGVHGRFLTDTRRTTLLDVQSYGAPANLDNLEGFLFPSTYQLRTPITIPALVADQLTAFRKQFATVNMSYAKSKNLTPYDVLKIASMVEAEAGTAHDRPLIASVIYNRLRLDMPLGIDATIRYAVNNYSTPLTDAQLADPSPYNTRLHTGLPPTPIDSPSLASIQAAAHPAQTNYLYFVAKPCGNGASAFASTEAQFNVDVERYDAARAARGGRSPLKC